MPILKEPYQNIVDNALERWRSSYTVNSNIMESIALKVAEQCQALAEPKPVKRLSDEQICALYKQYSPINIEYARAIEEAHIKLQQEPELQDFTVEWINGEYQAYESDDLQNWKPVDIIKQGKCYRMARKS